VNLKELSQHLGLSQTTVSRALNGYPEVSEATRIRVMEAAQLHNYNPNARARGLATGHSRCIGHVISVNDSGEIVNPIFGDFIAGAGEAYASHGYDLMMIRAGAQDEAEIYRSLKARGAIDGLVVHSPRTDDDRLPLLTEIGLPFVVHGRSSGSQTDYSWLDVNNRGAFSQATHYLVSLGHSRIALINGQESLDFAIRRRAGFESAMREAGLAIDPVLMASDEMTEEHGHAGASRMLDLPEPPSAFLVSSIISALGVRRALDERDLKPGRDVSIVTFDDCLSYLTNGNGKPVFSAMQSSVRAAGSALAQMLIDRIRNPDSPHVHTLWEAEFVVGASTGIARE
jgi:LacI family transcriptional regulator, galactose operon repressor